MRSIIGMLTLVSCTLSLPYTSHGQMKEVLPNDPTLRKEVDVAMGAMPGSDRVSFTLSGAAQSGYRVEVTLMFEEPAEAGVRNGLSAPLKVERSEKSGEWSTGFVASPQFLAASLVEVSIVDESPGVPRGRFWLYRVRPANWLAAKHNEDKPTTQPASNAAR